MYDNINRNLPPVPVSQFSMVPRADVPRSKFVSAAGYKTTFDADVLVPVFVEEVLPGDHWSISGTAFTRMATPLFPVMDNLYLDAFFFFVPYRIVWSNWVRFMGQQDNPASSIAYTIPQTTAPGATGWVQGSLGDFFGLPVTGTQVTVAPSVSALPFRAYNLIWNEWFRDQNLQNSVTVSLGDGPDAAALYSSLNRAKRPDYFTSALPWPLKGGTSVPLPLGTSAVVKTSAVRQVTGAQTPLNLADTVTGNAVAAAATLALGAGGFNLNYGAPAPGAVTGQVYPTNLFADLSTATGATINSLRLAVTTQQFLERDARGGTRYTELLRTHFGVTPQDSRVQRPEYCGGGGFMLHTQAIPQTSATGLTGGTSPIGALAGTTYGSGKISASYSSAEHGVIIGLVAVRADVTYQQGIRRMWTRSTRYDFYFPTFAFLGEQTIRQDEIYATGVVATDTAAFGYQERWAEYRYRPSMITGQFRSNIAGTLDTWHLAQYFSTPPMLNGTFIQSTTPITRVVAAGASSVKQQFLFDSVWHVAATRPLPMRSVPGLARF